MDRLLGLLGFRYITWEDAINGVVLVNGAVTDCRRIVVRKSQVVAPSGMMPARPAIGLAQVLSWTMGGHARCKWVVGNVTFRALP